MESSFSYNAVRNNKELELFIEKNLDLIVEHYHRAQQKYKCLYDNSSDLLRTVNLENVIVDCNQAYVDNLRYSKEEVIGKSILEHTADRSMKDMQDCIKEIDANESIRSVEIWLKRKDGTTFPTLLSTSSLYDMEGKMIGRMASLRDITDIYQAKEEIEQQKIKRISDMGVLSARIAHDLKNPLSVIKNSVELLKMRSDGTDEKTRKDYERIERATFRITHQIEEVLEYVWPKPLTFSDASISKILSSVISKINLQEVVVKLPPEDISIKCDAQKIEIVFSNLILNAIQAMEGEGTINIRTTDGPDFVLIEIEDSGHGIPEEILPKIFEPMFTTRQIGTGLGLVSCRSIVEKHGGSITIKTGLDKGTTFVIRLPKNHDIGRQGTD